MGAEQPQDVFVASPVQRQRSKRLRRFNVFFVYTPIGIVFVVAAVFVGFLVTIALSSEIADSNNTISATADIMVVLITLPALLVCGVAPAGLFGLMAMKKRRGIQIAKATQLLLWRLEKKIVKVDKSLRKSTSKIVRPLIASHARASQVGSLINRSGQSIKRRLR